MIINSLIKCRYPFQGVKFGVAKSSLFSSKVIFKGRASPEGTKAFIAQSNIKLHHNFHASDLYINPIIHGPPRGIGTGSSADTDQMLVDAVLRNRRNCFYVYNHSVDGVWYASDVGAGLGSEVDRTQLVTVAGLGYVTSARELAERLRDATQKTQLEHLDIVILEVRGEGGEGIYLI